MGIGDKLKFWKRDDFALDSGRPPEPPSYDLGAPPPPMMQPDPLPQSLPPESFSSNDAFSHEVFGRQNTPQTYPQSSPFPGSPAAHVPEAHEQLQESVHPRDVELILAKLDAIKSEIDALHQRVRKIEQVTEPQNQKRYW